MALPDFPKFKREAGRHLHRRFKNEISRRAPILAELRRTRQHEGRVWAHGKGSDAHQGQYQAFGAEMRLTREEMRGDFEAVLREMDQAAESFAKQQSEVLFGTVSEAADSVGNVIAAKGEFDQDVLLEAMEMIEADLDPATREPKNTFFVMHPETAEKVIAKVEAWEDDPEFQERLKALKERQWIAWRDRESRRRLAD